MAVEQPVEVDQRAGFPLSTEPEASGAIHHPRAKRTTIFCLISKYEYIYHCQLRLRRPEGGADGVDCILQAFIRY